MGNIYSAYLTTHIPLYFWQSLTFVLTYYGSIWATYLGAGYVNEYIRSKMFARLSRLRTDKKEVQDNIEFVLLISDKMFRGIYVSGLRMTVERAITFGGAVITVLVLLVRVHLIEIQESK